MRGLGSRTDSPVLMDMPARDEIEAAMEAILTSPQFRNSQQCSSFLRYVVKHSLTGEDHLLRERVIGHEVFHRAPDYETGEDPVVRIRAAEVRKRLAQYYQASSASVHIEIPSGSYRATFHLHESRGAALPSALPQPVLPPQVAVPALTEEGLATTAVSPLLESQAAAATTSVPDSTDLEATPPSPQRSSTPAVQKTGWKRWVTLAAICSGLSAIGTYFAVAHQFRTQRAESQLWTPWIDPRHPVLIAIGSNAVYRLQDQIIDQYVRENGLQTPGLEIYPSSQALAKLPASSYKPAENSFVALGDVTAAADFVAVLARQGQAAQQRFPNDISFAELRGSPTILIGGYNNPTSIELTRNMRFRLVGHNEIVDTVQPGRKWDLHASLDSHDTEDYAILTRTVQHGTDAPFLSVAGMGGYGTQAAAEFITSPEALSLISRRLGEGWQAKNIQLVLHVRIHDFQPVAPEIVASCIW